jgi:pyruvate kinase
MQTKAKIVATVGPASSSKEVMRDMIKAGVNVIRINFSHSDHDNARRIIETVYEINQELGTATAILADLQGPKLRIGEVEEGAVIKAGEELVFTTQEVKGSSERVYMNYKKFPAEVKPGERILLDDGKLICEVVNTDGNVEVRTKVIQGGPLNSRKGVNLPNTAISLPCLTEKDMADLEVALEEDVEWIGLSFVRQSADVRELREHINNKKARSKIISKIEKPGAVAEIDSIIKATDAVMVARGDLGVEVPLQGVPLIQKMIVEKCKKGSVPVIIATQMMESMIESMSPTRAEVNDVANSVLDGADAVMLSGETSVGAHPVQVIKVMQKIIRHIEDTAAISKEDNPPFNRKDDRYVSDSICYNASKIAEQIGARAILTMTHSGYNAFKISSHRPSAKVVVFTHNRKIMNTLSLLWGVQCFYYDKFKSTDETFSDISMIIEKAGLVKKGDLIVHVASMPITDRGMTNMLKISNV